MADDVDPTESLTSEPATAGHDVGSVGLSTAHGYDPVEIAMVEIDVVEFEQVNADAGTDVRPEPAPADNPEPAPPVQPPEPLPTMADLDRVASELDDIDARLAALDK